MVSWSDRPEAGQSRGCRLTLVVRDERVERGEIGGRCDVDRVQRPERRLCERPCGEQQRPVERTERDRVDQPAGTIDQEVDGKPGIAGPRTPDRAGHLGQDKLAGNELGVGEEIP